MTTDIQVITKPCGSAADKSQGTATYLPSF